MVLRSPHNTYFTGMAGELIDPTFLYQMTFLWQRIAEIGVLTFVDLPTFTIYFIFYILLSVT